VHQIPVAFKTAFLISRPGIKHRPVGQHGSPLVREIIDVAVAFQALFVFYGGVSLFPVFFMVVRGHGEVGQDVLDAMEGLGIEEVEGVLRRGQMAVHAVCHETLAVVGVGGGPPGVVGKSDLVTGGAKLRGGSPHHGVIGEAEEGESQENSHHDIEDWLEKFPHGSPGEICFEKWRNAELHLYSLWFILQTKSMRYIHPGSFLPYRIYPERSNFFLPICQFVSNLINPLPRIPF
jgi:hypothetical protein